MICPYCGCTNNDSAKFCKKCGKSLNPIKEEVIDSNKTNANNISSGKSTKNLIIICLTVIICTALIVGSVLFISYSNNSGTDNSNVNSSVNVVSDSVNQSSPEDDNEVQKTTTTTQEASTPSTISHVDWVEFYLDGNPNTGADATIYVGPEYSGENVEIGMSYSRNGNYFEFEGNNWYTVGSDGTIFVRTYAPLNKYPDKCEISLTHNDNTLSLTCPMKKHKGTQRVNL